MARKYKDTLERCGVFKVLEKLWGMLDLSGGVFFFERHQAYIKRCKPCNLNPNKRHLTWCVVVPPSSEPLFAKASSWCHLHYLTSQQMNCSQPAAPFMCMYIRIYTSHQRFQLSVNPNMSGLGLECWGNPQHDVRPNHVVQTSGQQIWSPKLAGINSQLWSPCNSSV